MMSTPVIIELTIVSLAVISFFILVVLLYRRRQDKLQRVETSIVKAREDFKRESEERKAQELERERSERSSKVDHTRVYRGLVDKDYDRDIDTEDLLETSVEYVEELVQHTNTSEVYQEVETQYPKFGVSDYPNRWIEPIQELPTPSIPYSSVESVNTSFSRGGSTDYTPKEQSRSYEAPETKHYSESTRHEQSTRHEPSTPSYSQESSSSYSNDSSSSSSCDSSPSSCGD